MQQCSYLYQQVPQLVKKFPTFYGTQRFITMFTYPYPQPDYSSPHPSILSISDPLGLPIGLIFFIFLNHKPASTSLMRTRGPAHLFLLDFITQLIFSEDYNSWGDHGSTVVKALCYKSEGRWFNPSWCQWIFHWHKILLITLWPWGRLSL